MKEHSISMEHSATSAQDLSSLLQTPNNDACFLSEREKVALELWDQLEELKLEQSLLEAQDQCRCLVMSRQSRDTLLTRG